MVAFLDDAAAVHDDEAVHRGDGREPVRDGDHGLAFHEPVQALLNHGLDFAVERAGGFVEQQDRRVLEHDPRDGDALALAAGELHPALADVGVVAATALGVGEAFDELVRLGAPGGRDHVVLGRVRAAIDDVVADRAVQQRGVLRDHPDLRAQAVLLHGGDVLPVDADHALFDVVEAQQQVDHGALARAGAADQPDLLARPDVQVEVVDDCATPAVAEGDVLETDLAARDLQRRCAGPVDDRVRPRQRTHAVLDRADVFEQRGHLPHDPVRDAVQAQRHGTRRRHRADADVAARPEQQGGAGGARDQRHAERVVRGLEAADEPHLRVRGLHELLHRVAHVTGFAARVREQLHGRDVGVRIGDPARHQRARIGLRGGHLAESRHEVAQARHVEREPAQERRQHPRVEAADHRQHRQEIDRDEGEDVHRGHPRVAHRERRLHHLGRDAPGELVLIEAHALAEHEPVEVPPQAHREVREQRLVLDQRIQPDHERARGDDRAEQQQAVALLRPELRRGNLRQPVDDPAEHREQQGLERGDDRRAERHREDVAAQAPGAFPHEREKAVRRRRRPRVRVGLDQAFELAEHGRGLGRNLSTPARPDQPC